MAPQGSWPPAPSYSPISNKLRAAHSAAATAHPSATNPAQRPFSLIFPENRLYPRRPKYQIQYSSLRRLLNPLRAFLVQRIKILRVFIQVVKRTDVTAVYPQLLRALRLPALQDHLVRLFNFPRTARSGSISNSPTNSIIVIILFPRLYPDHNFFYFSTARNELQFFPCKPFCKEQRQYVNNKARKTLKSTPAVLMLRL